MENFGRIFTDYIGASFAVGVANGTDALALGLRAMGIGQGYEVITVSHTAVASLAGIVQTGATPVLVDIDSTTVTFDPTLLEASLSTRTRALLPVHLYGHAADLDAISEFFRKQCLVLVEDSSQAHGGRSDEGRLGSIRAIGIFSGYPAKNFAARGDAGAITTSDHSVARHLCKLRQYGWESKSDSEEAGQNSRLDGLQAVVRRVKLAQLDTLNGERLRIAVRYTQMSRETALVLPSVGRRCLHANHLYVVETDSRTDLMEFLTHHGIGTGVRYP